VFKTILRKCKFISKIKKSAVLTNNFITMDLETRKIDNTLKPYCVSLFDGKEKASFYLSDYNNNIHHMLEAAMNFLMKRKYNGCRIYLHNFSNFDSVFLINTLDKLSDHTLKPNRRNGKLINVQFRFGKYSLYFRYSYLLLPSSLRDLAVFFNVSLKGFFPHTFLDNEKNPIDYVGEIPAYYHYFKLSKNASLSE
jgi:hypothetical protein